MFLLNGLLGKKETNTSLVPYKRNDTYYSAMIFVLSVGLTFLMYSFYRFLVEEKKRWKQVSTEFSRQRQMMDALTTEVQKFKVESKNTDDKWRDQIQQAIQPPVLPPPPSVPAPVILSANDMDRVLEEELSELQEMVTSRVTPSTVAVVSMVLTEDGTSATKQVPLVDDSYDSYEPTVIEDITDITTGITDNSNNSNISNNSEMEVQG